MNESFVGVIAQAQAKSKPRKNTTSQNKVRAIIVSNACIDDA